jgi:glycosyltransferase involved in cell wall biosynthesis
VNVETVVSGGDTFPPPFVLVSFFDGEPTEGGGYVHKAGVLRVLRRLQNERLKVVVVCSSVEGLETVERHGLRGVLQSRNPMRKLLGKLSEGQILRQYLGRSLGPRISPLDRLMVRLKANLVYFSSPDRRAYQLFSCAYIFSIFDLAHVEHPEFPEVSLFGEFEGRERLYTVAARKAVAVIVDSEHGRRVVAEQYRVPMSRIFATPFLLSSAVQGFVPNPATAIAVRERYGLVEPYIFYPAQFWAHKNHGYIITALSMLRQHHGWAPQAVFCGSDKGTLGRVLEFARSAGVDDLVKYCGFVPAEDIPYLYAGALALVMPTYLGPTNIPPREALALGVPVCYSDLPSFREDMGDSVIYVDLENPASLVDALQRLRMGCARIPAANRARVELDLEWIDEAYGRVLRTIIDRFRHRTMFHLNVV